MTFRFVCSAYIPLNNYMVFNDVDGLYTYTFEAERKVGFLCTGISVYSSQVNNGMMIIINFCLIPLYLFETSGELFILQPSPPGPALLSLSQAPGGARLPD